MKLSTGDIAILEQLQQDSNISQHELAEKVGMSRSSCWRRIREMIDIGLIKKTVAILSRRKLGLEITAYLEVSMTEHNETTKSQFEGHIMNLRQVLQCFSVSGERDYVLLVSTKNMDAYDHFLNTYILTHPAVRSARSTFTLREIKYSTEYNLQ
ncbi:Lrp/AsnC family transcriptional regulator [Temperatibacter marinus]|uniref:Lrp/AsnC family transcriptional regulator n=1 Tax=Temperatibacter marinus TaxID=1456591 RepID=A0AA52EGD1_9PROT|nr:Lrp/AsnC family transcriptional regulator [Temperatibacter marinus]WND02037.1 Lrp/AsnC family transcriptional regulator [Temperatibacter marinus]